MTHRLICGVLAACSLSSLWVNKRIHWKKADQKFAFFIGFPLFPGESEGDQLACIMEVFGEPSLDVLQVKEIVLCIF